MNNYSGKKHSKRIAMIALATVMLLLLSGTYAWIDYSQHKSNEFSEGNLSVYDVTLVENFEEVTDWKVEDGRIVNTLKVRNTGDLADGGPVYVRLQLKEYMEIADKIEDTYSDKRYMLDSTGEFIKFPISVCPSATKALTALNAYAELNFTREYIFTENDLERQQGLFDDEEHWYVITKGGDPNGQYGKHLLLTSGYENMVSLVPGVERSQDAYDPAKHHLHSSKECDYTVHMWDTVLSDPGCTHGFHDYVRWHLGALTRNIDGWDGFEGKDGRWYLDSVTGWAYWGEPLEPGQETAFLLEEVELITQPAGTFYYTIHSDMEAVSVDEADLFLN